MAFRQLGRFFVQSSAEHSVSHGKLSSADKPTHKSPQCGQVLSGRWLPLLVRGSDDAVDAIDKNTESRRKTAQPWDS